MEGLTKGFENLDRHIRNLQGFGQNVVVTFNRFDTDTEEEIELVHRHCQSNGVGFAINNAFLEGGEGAKALAQLVVDTIEKHPSHPLTYTYADNDSIKTKVEKVCRKIYGAASVSYDKTAEASLLRIQKLGLEHYPVCIAKTQFSFSADKKLYGSPTGFNIKIRDFVINAGSEMIVAIAGDIMRMPGLAKSPQAERIKIVDGQIEGLS